ncbi:Mss4-like protein [Pavlovales sp. CCMP2436]|nr:Mss4-like protein [Pavlovales sp. CCMP2436]
MQPFTSPPHWAPLAAPLVVLAPPTAPRSGGAVLSPPSSSISYDFDVFTSVAPAPGATTAPSVDGLTTHRGGCHCGAVRFECDAPSDLVAYDCNCSDCRMRRNLHFVVPADKLRLLAPEGAIPLDGPSGVDALAEYRWNSGVSRHLFCSRCGVCPFYRPRSNPNGWGVTFQCIDPGTVSSVEVRRFDGQHWEDFINGAGSSIRDFSSGALRGCRALLTSGAQF